MTTEDHTPTNQNPRPVLTFDPVEYVGQLEDCDLTEAQQTELLQLLWQIVVQFVDLGFGIHPVQQAVDKTATDSMGMDAESAPVVGLIHRSTATDQDSDAMRPAGRSRGKV